MSKLKNDISDDEIRIISSSQNQSKTKGKKKYVVIAAVIALAVILAAIIIPVLLNRAGQNDNKVLVIEKDTAVVPKEQPILQEENKVKYPFCVARDTVVNGVELVIITPENATPVLQIGIEALSDTAAVLVTQAADIRGDNGQIAGTFVLKGDLISRGHAKSGFCAIINGVMTIGTADTTPLVEQAIESEGYFFRQYSLVVGGQVIENKLQMASLRKALAEINDKICVVLSKEKLTLHEFSEALVNAGVRNAIYLVGSSAAGFYKDESGEIFRFGIINRRARKNVSYIVWK